MRVDYRDSHKDPHKGRSYHKQFSENPYRSLIWEFEKSALGRIVKKFLSDRIVTHLDFACGTGRILEFLMDDVSSSVGVDVSESMLNEARNRLAGCEIVNADITKDDSLKGRKFDLITAFRFFPNAQDELRQNAMNELVARMDDNGILVFNNHKNYSSTTYSLGRLFVRKNLDEMKSNEVDELVHAAGLMIVDTYHVGVVPATDNYRVLPIALLRSAESFFSKFEKVRWAASNIIYVCKHRNKDDQADLLGA